MKIRRITGYVLAALLAFGAAAGLGARAHAAAPTLESPNYVLMDAATGQVLYQKGADEQLAPAGLVKIMTAMIASEREDQNEKIPATASALASIGSDARKLGLVGGEMIRFSDLIYSMILTSSNDTANVIAETFSGSISAFVTAMNEKAAELGAENTNFVNAHGLTATGQYSSPRDIALILRHAMSNESFTKYFGASTHTIPATNTHSQDRPIRTTCFMCRNSDYFYTGSTGGMIGVTTPSKYVIAVTAERDGRHLIAVVMQAATENSMYGDAKRLLDFGFSDFTPASYTPADFDSLSLPLTEDGVRIGTAKFTLENDVGFLLRNDYERANLVAKLIDQPASIPKDGEGPYKLNLYYSKDGSEELLRSDILLKVDITVDPIVTDPDATTPPQSVIVTGTDGLPVTDEEGNVVTSIVGSSPGTKKGGFAEFIRIFFIVLLIIIGAITGLILLFILILFIIKYVRRAKRRRARRSRRY